MYIYGRNAILEAVKSGTEIEKVFFMYGQEGDAIERLRIEAKREGIACVTVDRQRFHELERRIGQDVRTQGVIASVTGIPNADIDQLVQDLLDAGASPLIAVLDGITDPHNVGAIIRSAECAGFNGVVMGQRDSSGITDVVSKTSAGAVNHLPIARVSNIGDVLLSLQQSGLKIVGMDEEGDVSYLDYDFISPAAVVIGSEGKGMSSRIRKMCDVRLTIPMLGKISSLNASVAAGVVFFEAMRQRRGGAGD